MKANSITCAKAPCRTNLPGLRSVASAETAPHARRWATPHGGVAKLVKQRKVRPGQALENRRAPRAKAFHAGTSSVLVQACPNMAQTLPVPEQERQKAVRWP